MKLEEQWLPVVGYDDLYEVSDYGRVRSLPRPGRVRGGATRTVPGHILRPYKMKKLGHLAIDLTAPAAQGRGPRRRTRVHILVLEAFRGPRPEGYAACHNDGDVENNHLSNLRWDTYSSNNHDVVRHGKHWAANKTHCPKNHPLDGVAYRPDGTVRQRYCKTCNTEHSRRAKAKARARKKALIQ